MPAPTIGFLINGGYEVTATCKACRTRKKLDLMALAVAYGETAIAIDLAARMRCSCGHRGAELSVAPVNAVGYARSHI